MDLSNRYVKTNSRSVFEVHLSSKKAHIKKEGMYNTLMSVVPDLLGRVATLAEIDTALKTVLTVHHDSKERSSDEGLFAVYLLIWVMDAITYPEKFNSVGITESLAELYAKLWPSADALTKARAVILNARSRQAFHIPS